MRTINKMSAAILVGICSAAGLYAQDFNGREHPMNVLLTFSSEGELTSSERVSGQVTTTVYQNKILVERLGNREFLEYLVEIGVIQSISGWSLAFFSSTEGEGYEVGTYITRKGQSPINVSAYLDIATERTIEGVKGRIIENESTGFYFEVGSGVSVAIGNLYLEDELVASGIARTAFAYRFEENGVVDSRDELLGGVITSITGYIEDDDGLNDDDFLSLIEGVVRFSSGRRIVLPSDVNL